MVGGSKLNFGSVRKQDLQGEGVTVLQRVGFERRSDTLSVKDPNNRAKVPNKINSIWGLKHCYLGPWALRDTV